MLLKIRRDTGKEVKVREMSSVVITKFQSLVKYGEHNVCSNTKLACLSFLTSTNKIDPGYQRKHPNLDE